MDSSKKRKRTDNATNGSNKRPMPAYSSVNVKHVPPEETHLGPIVAFTPGITAPEDITFTPYKKTLLSRSTGKQRRQVLLQSSQHGRLDYIAQEEEAGGPNGNLRHYVAVFDASAGEFTITEAHKVTLRATLRPTQEELDEEATARDRQTYATMRMTLGQEFGTKKAKKVIADQTVNAINQRRPGETAPAVDAAQQHMLDQLEIKTENMLTQEEKQREIDKNKPRPEYDGNAKTPADVYPIENLISEENLELIKVMDWQQAAKKGQGLDLPLRYVSKRMQRVATMKDTASLKLLKYMNMALTWYTILESNRGGKRIPNKDKVREKVDAPAAILDSLKRQFADGINVTKWYNDRFCLFMCAIALHIDQYQVDTHDLGEDLRLTPNQMQTYFSELGCRVTKLTANEREMYRVRTPQEAETHRMAKLQLPLEFPKERRGGGAPRR